MNFYLTFFLSLTVLSLPAQSEFQTTTALFGDLRVRQIGPAVMSGRVSCLAVDPTDATTIYVGSGGGGLWKTDNGGIDLRPVFDEHTQSIGAVAVAPSAPDTVYVGTGEPWVRNSVSIGTGVYRSTDGGKRWQQLGLDSTERIAEIEVHPDDPDVAYVAALGPLWSDGEQRGLFKTTDGGQSWQKVLYLNEHTGAASLSMDPLHPDTLFVAMWSHRRTPDRFDSGYRGSSGLYRSHDGGASWEKIEGGGFPGGKLGRIGVTIAASNPDRIYASVETEDADTKGLYRSDDGGTSWQLVDKTFGNQVRPFYFARVRVDPSNDSIVGKCAVNAIISEDAGHTWRVIGGGVHSDYHDIWFDPDDGRHMLVATDGGVYESFDRGRSFRMWQNLPVSQFYHVSVDMADPYRVYGGLQDNGSWFGPSRSPGGITAGDWRFTLGGDGFYSFRHPTKPHYVFSEYQGGMLRRFDERNGRSKAVAPYAGPNDEALRYNWNAPIHLSTDGERLYFASQYLFVSEDDGENWHRISPDLTTNDTTRQQQATSGGLSIDNSGAENYTTIYAVAESPLDEQTVWVGTDDGKLQLTTDGGESWTELQQRIPDLPVGSWVTFVEPSPHDARTALVTFDNHRRGDMATYLYRTDDGGQNWQRLHDEEMEGYALSVRQDPGNANLLFLGTEFGLYVSLDGGASWAPFRAGIPRVGVRDMVIHPREGDLVMATHGRGIIILDELEALRQLTPELTSRKIAFLKTPITYFNEGAGAGAAWFGGGGGFTGQNPDTDVRIMYYASKRHTFGKMYAEIYRDGKKLRELQASKSAGLNILSLPTTLEKPESPPTNNRMARFGSASGPQLAEGDYDLHLIKGRDTFRTTFTLAGHPESPYSSEDREAQRELALQLYHDLESLAATYDTLQGIVAEADSTQPALAARAQALIDEMVFLDGDGYIDEDSKLGEQLSQLYFDVNNFPGRPSGSQVAEAARLQARVEEMRGSVEELTASP